MLRDLPPITPRPLALNIPAMPPQLDPVVDAIREAALGITLHGLPALFIRSLDVASYGLDLELRLVTRCPCAKTGAWVSVAHTDRTSHDSLREHVMRGEASRYLEDAIRRLIDRAWDHELGEGVWRAGAPMFSDPDRQHGPDALRRPELHRSTT